MEYELIRSDRRSVSLEIKDMRVVVRAPRRMDVRLIDKFVSDHAGWIDDHMERQERRRENHHEPEDGARRRYIQAAKEYLPQRVAFFSDLMGLYPAGITITGAKTRFGSCSSRGRLSFSWRLMQYPQDAIDYVVVHELAHLRHMNHGREFYSLIEKYLPDYKARRKLLKE